jgi:hypothetical protein
MRDVKEYRDKTFPPEMEAVDSLTTRYMWQIRGLTSRTLTRSEASRGLFPRRVKQGMVLHTSAKYASERR